MDMFDDGHLSNADYVKSNAIRLWRKARRSATWLMFYSTISTALTLAVFVQARDLYSACSVFACVAFGLYGMHKRVEASTELDRLTGRDRE